MARRMHLLLVAPYRFYRRPPDLEVPQLRAAFDRGVADGSGEPSDQRRDWLVAAQSEERRAYWLARQGPAAPPRLALALIPVLAADQLERALAARRESERFALRIAVFAAATAVLARVWPRVERRSARTAGLTHQTAPVTMVDPTLFMQMGVALAVGIVRWLRTGERSPVDPGTALAVRLVREIMRRRSWNAVRREIAART